MVDLRKNWNWNSTVIINDLWITRVNRQTVIIWKLSTGPSRKIPLPGRSLPSPPSPPAEYNKSNAVNRYSFRPIFLLIAHQAEVYYRDISCVALPEVIEGKLWKSFVKKSRHPEDWCLCACLYMCSGKLNLNIVVPRKSIQSAPNGLTATDFPQ